MSARRNSLLRSTSGAVAPTVALSLFGLIAAGGRRLPGNATPPAARLSSGRPSAENSPSRSASVGTVARQHAGGRRTNATRTASDERAPARQVEHGLVRHRSPPIHR